MQESDVLIIGAGSVGCAISRELARYKLNVVVLEKESDVACGTSGRNSAVVHAGFNNKVGSLMAKYCVEGNEMFEELCKELDVPYNKTGKLVVAFNDEDVKILDKVIAQGIANGCKGLRLIEKEELDSILPDVGGIKAMLSPNTAIFNPFLYCIALAENAVENGVKYYLNREVTSIEKENGYFIVHCHDELFKTKYLINSAGLFADRISAMAGIDGYKIHPCRGEYLILDKAELKLPVYPAPQAGIGGLGVHITPTSDGNIIIGPSNEYIDDPSDYSCTAKVMKNLITEAKQLLPTINERQVIGMYSGIRPKLTDAGTGGYRDFVIKSEPDCPGFINLVGIESPGLTASVPIARAVVEILKTLTELEKKENFNPVHKSILRFSEQTPEEQERLVREDPEYGDIVCRCQKITKHEIRQAIENPLGARSVTAIKYRAWPTTGRCNGGYCLPKIARMLVDEYGMKPEEITYRSEGSEMFTGEVK